MANFERMTNRLVLVSIIFLFLASACKQQRKSSIDTATSVTAPQLAIGDSNNNFFPVTTYLKGEIYGIKTGGITPIKKITTGNKTDSSWVHANEFDSVFAVFLNPLIDTANLKNIYTEKKFLDQTLDAYTFTYDIMDNKPDTFAFKHWDVYVDPESNKVKRIYMAKTVDAQTDLKLFWESGKWCKIITVKTLNGNATVSKEEKISWSYD